MDKIRICKILTCRHLLKPEIVEHRIKLPDKTIGSLIPIANTQKQR